MNTLYVSVTTKNLNDRKQTFLSVYIFPLLKAPWCSGQTLLIARGEDISSGPLEAETPVRIRAGLFFQTNNNLFKHVSITQTLMARMHARRKGKSGSKKPIDTKNVWLRYGAKEIELLIQKLAKRGTTASVIGMKLRDTYGIPDVKKITKKSISEILTKHKLAPPLPQDLIDLIKKDITLSSHRETNKKDMTAKRGTTLTESKINRLVKYYKSTGKLKPDWQYRRDQARLLIS